MPWMGLAIGAGLGLLKSEMVDAPAAERQRKVQAATTRYSPWTHMQAAAPTEADPFSSALQFGATGASMGAGMKQADAQTKYMDALSDRLNTGGSIGSWGGGKNLYNYMPGTGSSGTGGVSGLNYNQSPSDFWGLGK